MPKRTKVALNPDAFDALELSALVNGGIGAACLYELANPEDDAWHKTPDVPCCIMGHAMFLDGLEPDQGEGCVNPDTHPVCAELIRAFPALADRVKDEGLREEAQEFARFGQHEIIMGIENLNDTLVRGADNAPRITFKQWCKLMRVVRGA